MVMNPKKKTKNILILQTAFLGDVILSTPLLRGIKKNLPDARITMLTIPETAIVFRDNPYVHACIHFNKRPSLYKLVSFISLIFRIRRGRYDLAISIQSSLTSSFLLFLANVPVRLGFSRQKLVTHSVPHTQGLHKVDKILGLLTFFTDKKFSMQTELFWSEKEEKTGAEIVKTARKGYKHIVAMAPGSIWYTKQWIKVGYQELIRLLHREGVQTILVGGKEDFKLCQTIKASSDAMIMAGRLNILESASLIQKTDLIVTNDSAPLHIGNAVQTDVVAIFGPTVQTFGFYPYRKNDQVIEVDLDCRTCGWHGSRKCPLKHHHCMRWITPVMVFEAVMKRLNA